MTIAHVGNAPIMKHTPEDDGIDEGRLKQSPDSIFAHTSDTRRHGTCDTRARKHDAHDKCTEKREKYTSKNEMYERKRNEKTHARTK